MSEHTRQVVKYIEFEMGGKTYRFEDFEICAIHADTSSTGLIDGHIFFSTKHGTVSAPITPATVPDDAAQP